MCCCAGASSDQVESLVSEKMQPRKYPERACAALGLASLVFFSGPHAYAQMGTAITSPAFDTSIYKDGAVAQSRRAFGNWNLVCADVNGLSRRFCNITTKAQDKTGRVFVAMLISTTDEGKPAALLSVPLFVSLKDGVEIGLNGKSGKLVKASKATKLQILTCQPTACSTVWPLEQTDIVKLAQSGSLRIRIHLYAPDSVEQLASMGLQPKALDVVFDGSGFAEALKASQSP